MEQIEGILDLYIDLRCPVDGQVSGLSFPGESGTNSPSPEGWQA